MGKLALLWLGTSPIVVQGNSRETATKAVKTSTSKGTSIAFQAFSYLIPRMDMKI